MPKPATPLPKTGVAILDDEHQKLVTLLDLARCQAMAGEAPSAVGTVGLARDLFERHCLGERRILLGRLTPHSLIDLSQWHGRLLVSLAEATRADATALAESIHRVSSLVSDCLKYEAMMLTPRPLGGEGGAGDLPHSR